MADANQKLIRKLNDLIELDFDAIEAYTAAVARLKNPDYRYQLEAFCGDHERHTRNLSVLVRRMGGEPAKGPDAMRLLTKGKVVIGALVGDYAILLAMRANEEVTNKRYEVALAADGNLDAETRSTLESNLADERRHREWIAQQLKNEEREGSEGEAESTASESDTIA